MSNSRELIDQALEIQAIERIPAIYQYLAGGPAPFNALGLEMEECYYDAVKFARACVAVRDAYGYDNIMAGWGSIVLEAHAHGTEIRFHHSNKYPQATRPGLADPSMIEELEPVDPLSDELFRVRLEATRILVDRFGEEYAVMGNMLAPAVVAWELRGYEAALMDMFYEKELAHRYLRIVLESLRMHGERLREAGADIVFLEDDFTAGQEYVPLESMMEFDLDYSTSLVGHLKALGHRVLVHNCSRLPLVERQIKAMRPHAIHYNAFNVPEHAEMCRRVKGRVCLCPGIDEGLVYEGPPERIEEAVRRAANELRDHDAFMMGAAYEVPFSTPRDNHLALVSAIKSLRR